MEEINDFLKSLNIGRKLFSEALGMNNPSSFNRCRKFEDFKSIKNKNYINRLSFIFDTPDITTISYEEVVKDKEVLKRIMYLRYFYIEPKIQIPKETEKTVEEIVNKMILKEEE